MQRDLQGASKNRFAIYTGQEFLHKYPILCDEHLLFLHKSKILYCTLSVI